MTTVSEIMTTHLVFVDPDDRVEQAIKLMLRHSISGLPVVNDVGELLGVITEYDILEMIDAPETAQDKVFLHMTRDLVTVDVDTSILQAASIFLARSIRRIPVVKESRLVGIVSRRELIQFVQERRQEDREYRVIDMCLSPGTAGWN